MCQAMKLLRMDKLGETFIKSMSQKTMRTMTE